MPQVYTVTSYFQIEINFKVLYLTIEYFYCTCWKLGWITSEYLKYMMIYVGRYFLSDF